MNWVSQGTYLLTRCLHSRRLSFGKHEHPVLFFEYFFLISKRTGKYIED